MSEENQHNQADWAKPISTGFVNPSNSPQTAMASDKKSDWVIPTSELIVGPSKGTTGVPAVSSTSSITPLSSADASPEPDQQPDWAKPVSVGIVHPLGYTTNLPLTSQPPDKKVDVKTPPPSPGSPPSTPGKGITNLTSLSKDGTPPPLPDPPLNTPPGQGRGVKTPRPSPGLPLNTPSNQLSKEGTPPPPPNPPPNTPAKRTLVATGLFKGETLYPPPNPLPSSPMKRYLEVAALSKGETPPPQPNTPAKPHAVHSPDNLDYVPIIACGPKLDNNRVPLPDHKWEPPKPLPPSENITIDIIGTITIPAHILGQLSKGESPAPNRHVGREGGGKGLGRGESPPPPPNPSSNTPVKRTLAVTALSKGETPPPPLVHPPNTPAAAHAVHFSVNPGYIPVIACGPNLDNTPFPLPDHNWESPPPLSPPPPEKDLMNLVGTIIIPAEILEQMDNDSTPPPGPSPPPNMPVKREVGAKGLEEGDTPPPQPDSQANTPVKRISKDGMPSSPPPIPPLNVPVKRQLPCPGMPSRPDTPEAEPHFPPPTVRVQAERVCRDETPVTPLYPQTPNTPREARPYARTPDNRREAMRLRGGAWSHEDSEDGDKAQARPAKGESGVFELNNEEKLKEIVKEVGEVVRAVTASYKQSLATGDIDTPRMRRWVIFPGTSAGAYSGELAPSSSSLEKEEKGTADEPQRKTFTHLSSGKAGEVQRWITSPKIMASPTSTTASGRDNTVHTVSYLSDHGEDIELELLLGNTSSTHHGKPWYRYLLFLYGSLLNSATGVSTQKVKLRDGSSEVPHARAPRRITWNSKAGAGGMFESSSGHGMPLEKWKGKEKHNHKHKVAAETPRSDEELAGGSAIIYCFMAIRNEGEKADANQRYINVLDLLASTSIQDLWTLKSLLSLPSTSANPTITRPPNIVELEEMILTMPIDGLIEPLRDIGTYIRRQLGKPASKAKSLEIILRCLTAHSQEVLDNMADGPETSRLLEDIDLRIARVQGGDASAIYPALDPMSSSSSSEPFKKDSVSEELEDGEVREEKPEKSLKERVHSMQFCLSVFNPTTPYNETRFETAQLMLDQMSPSDLATFIRRLRAKLGGEAGVGANQRHPDTVPGVKHDEQKLRETVEGIVGSYILLKHAFADTGCGARPEEGEKVVLLSHGVRGASRRSA